MGNRLNFTFVVFYRKLAFMNNHIKIKQCQQKVILIILSVAYLQKSSCLLECQATALLDKYRCLPYYLPALPLYFIRTFIPDYGKKKGVLEAYYICRW